MSRSKGQEVIFLHVAHFTERKLHHLWFRLRSRFSNVLDAENDEMFSRLFRRLKE
jgi:hypothetical protein